MANEILANEILATKPAYLKFEGDMLEAFNVLTNSMQKKGGEQLLSYGKFKQTYAEGADELKQTPDFTATEFNTSLAGQLKKDLAACAAPDTPPSIAPAMTEMVDLCSNFLAQHAEFNKDKGKAFKILMQEMKKKAKNPLYQKDKIKRTYGEAATILEKSKGLETDHDDPNLSQELHSKLSDTAKGSTPEDLKKDMTETVDLCSKYLSQQAVDEVERGPAFDILIKKLEAEGSKDFTPQFGPLKSNFDAAYVLKTAPGLGSIDPDPATAPVFVKALQAVAADVCPQNLKQDMDEVIGRCGNYLSGFIRDREKALQIVLNAMKKTPTKELVKRGTYTMDYGTGAMETETTPTIVPYLPIKDISDEMKVKLNKDTESTTPANMKVPVKCAVSDVSKHLSQGAAVRSKAAGERYPLNLLAEVMKSSGDKKLYQEKNYTNTYRQGGTELQYAGKLEEDPKAQSLQAVIGAELQREVPAKIAPTIATSLGDTMKDAAKHLAKTGKEKSESVGYLIQAMKEEGDAKLGTLQGYEQTYKDGALRIEGADSLANDKVDKAAYANVHGKLQALMDKKPNPETAKAMPGMIDEASQYLAAPIPETGAEKRKVLRDLMGRRENEILVEDGNKKMTFTQGGKEIINAPVGVTTTQDEASKTKIKDKIDNAIPNKNLKDLLDTPTEEGAAYLSDIFKDGEAEEAAKRAGLEDEEARRRQDASALAPKCNKQLPGEAEEAARREAGGAESEEARCRREAEEAARRAAADEAAKRRARRKGTGDTDAEEAERQAALEILHRQLQAKAGETFYRQAHSELSHKAASDWLKNPSPVHQSVKESGDTSRLANKFERKLDGLVTSNTPDQLKESMQDVVIEASHSLAGYFVGENYKALVKDGLIYEMQKHGHNTLIDKRGVAETNFFAAQRLKQMEGSIPTAPDVELSRTASHLCRKLEDTIKCRTMPRKLLGTMKAHIRNTAHYLSDIVTTPDPKIEAYVALLKEMETQGSALLIEGGIPKTFKDSAAYLRLLTSYQDQINLSDSGLEGSTINKLSSIMNNVPERDYTKADLDAVIRQQAKLLVSYIVLQGKRTALLKQMVDRLASAPGGLLLRHGSIRQSNGDGARILQGKNTDQLIVTSADPVVERKVQIKIVSLMEGLIPDNEQELMGGVIADATRYLAVHLLQPHTIQVCKCMKSVFVQCELWCDEIFRRMSRPCCSCSRQLMLDELSQLAPDDRLLSVAEHAFAPGIDINVRPCSSARAGVATPCPAPAPTEGCQTSYMLYSTEYNRLHQHRDGPTKLERSSANETHVSLERSSPRFSSSSLASQPIAECTRQSSSYFLSDLNQYSESVTTSFYTLSPSDKSSANTLSVDGKEPCMDTGVRTPVSLHFEATTVSVSTPCSDSVSNGIPLVSTDQMGDWHAMMVSLAWNVQAWRKWIQETVDRAVTYHQIELTDSVEASWNAFRRKIATEALQWRQYSLFSRQLILRLAVRYRDKKIVSPTRGTVKNRIYVDCQHEMIQIIEMFNKWTHIISVIVKETDSLRTTSSSTTESLQNDEQWNHFKSKVEEYAEDWKKYNTRLLKLTWENKFMGLIPVKLDGPVWVVSACGAVPSGAVAAGGPDEPTWVARTTHRGRVLPAALRPSMHCCVLYAQGTVHHYTKYQVLCNADVEWVLWHAGGAVPTRAVVVAPAVLVGRVRYRGAHLLGAVPAPHYRCHVVILGRPFAVNTYEVLVLADTNT